MWSPSVATATQVSRWFPLSSLRTDFNHSFMFDFDRLGLNVIHSTARNLHTCTRTHVCKGGLGCSIPLDHLLGFIMRFNVQSVVQSTPCGGFLQFQPVWSPTRDAQKLYWARQAHTSSVSPWQLMPACYGGTRLLENMVGLFIYLFLEKVMLSCCRTSREVWKQWGIAPLAHC